MANIKKKIIPLLKEIKENGQSVDYDGLCKSREEFNLWFETWIKEPIEEIEKELMRTY